MQEPLNWYFSSCCLISTQQPTHSLKIRSHPSLWLPITLEWNLEKPTMPSMFWAPLWPHFLALYTCTFRPHGLGPIFQSPWHACLRLEHISPLSHSCFYLYDTSSKKPSLTPILIKTIFPSFFHPPNPHFASQILSGLLPHKPQRNTGQAWVMANHSTPHWRPQNFQRSEPRVQLG